MDNKQVRELLLQSLEHERGEIHVDKTALRCAVHADLRKEWEGYLSRTEGSCG